MGKKKPTAAPSIEPGGMKRNLPRTEEGEGAGLVKKRVRILSANTFGFDYRKWEKIENIANDLGIDLILIQESANAKVVDQIVDRMDWQATTVQEAAWAPTFQGERVTPDLGVHRYYTTLARTGADIKVERRAIPPMEQCPSVCELLGRGQPEPARQPEGMSVRRPTRVRKKPMDQAKLRALALRAPDSLELTMPGRQPVIIFNNHAPQGSGSAIGFSGRDAPLGHEVQSAVMKDLPAPYVITVGDQNAEASQMRKLYPEYDIISAAGGDRLSHAAIPRGLQAAKIDVGQAGRDFNNKGQQGCSDHTPFAFELDLPPM